MKLSPLFMEIWSFETIHCLNFNKKCQKRHDAANDVKVNFLICRFDGCIENMLFPAKILFHYPKHMCNGVHRKVDTDSSVPVCMI